jgi:hypothetical protein
MGGSLIYEEIEDIFGKYPVFRKKSNFIETGTYKGDTTMMASKHFKNVYTVEIVPALYNESILRAKKEGAKNINFYLGDSLDLLKVILPKIEDGGSSFFFIDAHQSGYDTGNNNKYLVPLLQELEIIVQHNVKPSVFIFDDVRFWNGETQEAWDWADINREKITSLIEKYGFSILETYTRNDRFYVITV